MPFDPLTIVFAVVAVLVVWKLNSVLGQNTGFQRQRPPVPSPPPGSNVVQLPGRAPTARDPGRWANHIDGDAQVAPGLEAIAAADPSFSAESFLDGARVAYEAIITAFAAGERRSLKSLLAPPVYEGFDAAIAEREAKKERLTTTFVSIGDAKFRSATLEGTVARVGVRFLSKQISATHGSDGELRSGSPDQETDMDDVWVFSRDVTSRDPNWTLVATASGH